MAEPQKQDYSKYPDDGTFSEFEAPDVTAWKLTRAAIEHENNLVNQRITWLLSSQAYLFTAFGALLIAWAKKDLGEFHPLIPYFILGIGFLAIYICLIIQTGLWRASSALESLTQYHKAMVNSGFTSAVKNANDQKSILTRTPPLHIWRGYPSGVTNQHFLPLAVIVVWLLLLAVFWLHSRLGMENLISRIGMREAFEILAFFAALALGYMLNLLIKGKALRAQD